MIGLRVDITVKPPLFNVGIHRELTAENISKRLRTKEEVSIAAGASENRLLANCETNKALLFDADRTKRGKFLFDADRLERGKFFFDAKRGKFLVTYTMYMHIF